MPVKAFFLELEKTIFQQLEPSLSEIGLEKGYYSLYTMNVNWLEGKVELRGFNKMKGDEFVLIYDYDVNDGTLHYSFDTHSTRIKNIGI